MKKSIVVTSVLFYTFADFLGCFFLFVSLDHSANRISEDIFSFQFGISPFDLLIFAVFRFCVLTGACIAVTFNTINAIIRVNKLLVFVLYWSCFIAMYTVVKVMYYTEYTDSGSKRMWSMIGITFISTVSFYLCWNFLSTADKECLRKRILKINETCRENGSKWEISSLISTNSSLEDDEDIKQDKLNSLDKEESRKYTVSMIVSKLIKMAKNDVFYICLAFVSLTLCSIGEIFLPFYTGQVLNYIIIDKSMQKFQQAMFYMALITLGTGFTSGLRAGFFTFASGRYMLRLQNLLFSCIVWMEIGFFDARKTGEITSRLTSDCTKIGDSVGLNLNVFARNVVKIIGILFFMIKLSWKLSLLALVGIPVIAIVSKAFGDRFRKVSEKMQNSLAHANASAEEAISSIRTVHSFAAEDHEIKRYSDRLQKVYNLKRKEGILVAIYRWATELTDLMITLLVLYFGGHLVLRNELKGGDLVSFILYSIELGFAFDEIGDVYTGIMEAVGAARNVIVYCDRQPLVKSGCFIPTNTLKGEVQFCDVSFSYPSRPDVMVLKNLSFQAKPGEVVALVGASGGGKSSIVSLLEHFYEPTTGEILVDKKCIKDYDNQFIHGEISLVQQEPALFARSIGDNIKYGLNAGVSEDDVRKAAVLANADIFIDEMPELYETGTGEKGIQLSGGQKQRIAIARALIRNPVVLILDEATSALDTESEYLVQQAINKNLCGRTVIIIAHRLSTIEKADKILVVDKGEIVEEGTHMQLIATEGVYASLVKRQILGKDEPNKSIDATQLDNLPDVDSFPAKTNYLGNSSISV